MRKQTQFIIGFVALAATLTFAVESVEENYKPKEGYVPDARTAIKIAVAVWEPIYGEKEIEEEKPYQAQLTNGVWTVTGSLPPRWTVGGVALAEIAKDDGKILRVIHGK